MLKRGWQLIGCLVILTGCYLNSLDETTTPAGPPPTPTIATLLVQDQSAVMAGICFEAAFDAAGQVFVLHSAEEHIRFYELADNSQLCRSPVARKSFDFDDGRVLAGLWSKGTGCTADHEVQSMNRDDAARRISIELQFITEGDCEYELLRPFWIALEHAAEYEVEIMVDS